VLKSSEGDNDNNVIMIIMKLASSFKWVNNISILELLYLDVLLINTL